MTLDPTKLAGVREAALERLEASVGRALQCDPYAKTLEVGLEDLCAILAAQSEAARWRELLGKVFDSRAPDYVDQAYPGWSTEARSALSTQTQGGGENG